MRRRVVVTGIGAITPLGTGVEKSWQALCQGKSGIDRITSFDPSPFHTQFAGEVRDFVAEDLLDRKIARRMDRFIQFAVAAAQMAVEDSGIKITTSNADRVGVAVGNAVSGILSIEKYHQLLLQGLYHKISPFFVPGFISNMAAGQVAIRFGAKGPNLCPVTACAAGTHAIGDSYRIIQRGDADIMITGGAEAGITPLMFAGLTATGALSTRNSAPKKASRPFDKLRDGFVVGEGAGIVILEELGLALRRGAKIYGEIVGYGANCDAYHITSPSPLGESMAACIRLALADARISPQEIDYINAHGTSTLLNDQCETAAIKTVFGEHSQKMAISSNKSMIGHLWGASGAVEAIFSLFSINQGIIPPTINYEVPDPECDLDYVPNVARKVKVTTILSNSFGFGGTNASLVLQEFSES